MWCRFQQPLAITLLFLGFILLFYTANMGSNYWKTSAQHNEFDELKGGFDSELSPDSLFLYRAYMQTLNNSSWIRILAISRCITSEKTLEGSVNGVPVVFRARPIERTCPWKWAPGCLYNSYVFDANMMTKVDAKSITLTRNGKHVRLPLHHIPSRKPKGTLSVCVPPIYWFTDWTKMILFLEVWKAQGAQRVFMYYHSSTKNVRSVIDFYERKGFVTVIEWPSLPRSLAVDPNRSLYRLAHSLAHNDCVMRITSEIGALVDIDELIVPRSGSLLSYVVQRFSDPSVGALSFTHRGLIFHPPLAERNFSFQAVDFSGIHNATESPILGPPKVVFRTVAVDMQSTHAVASFTGEFTLIKVPLDEAVLLHHRYTNVNNANSTIVNIFPSGTNMSSVQAVMVTSSKNIFPKGADFHFETQKVLGVCLKPWREEQNECKTPISTCRDLMMPLEDWFITKAPNQFLPL